MSNSDSDSSFSSGTHFTISSHLSKTSNSQLGVKEGFGKHWWPNPNHWWHTDLGIFVGAAPGMVSNNNNSTGPGFHRAFRYTAPPPIKKGHQLESPTYENTVLFLVSCFQYILVAAAFSIGPPYRQSMWSNSGFKVVLELTRLRRSNLKQAGSCGPLECCPCLAR